MADTLPRSSTALQRALPIAVEIAVNVVVPIVVYDQTVARLG